MVNPKAIVAFASTVAGIGLFGFIAKVQTGPSATTLTEADSFVSATSETARPIEVDLRLGSIWTRPSDEGVLEMPTLRVHQVARTLGVSAPPSVPQNVVPQNVESAHPMTPCSEWQDLGPKAVTHPGAPELQRRVRQLC